MAVFLLLKKDTDNKFESEKEIPLKLFTGYETVYNSREFPFQLCDFKNIKQ